jgi:hypothetical protein
MSIPMSVAGVLYVTWIAMAIPTIVHLAGRKTNTRGLTIAWGFVTALVPVLGLLFILGLLLKDDRSKA